MRCRVYHIPYLCSKNLRVYMRISSPSRGSNARRACVSLSESSHQLVYPHFKLARRWRPTLLHTDAIYLTPAALVLRFTPRLYCSPTAATPGLHTDLSVSRAITVKAARGQEPAIDGNVGGGRFSSAACSHSVLSCFLISVYDSAH